MKRKSIPSTYKRRLKKSKRGSKIAKSDYKLHLDGFEIVSSNIPSPEIIDEIRTIGDDGYIIFNDHLEGGDDKRSQTFIDKYILSNGLGNWTDSIKELLSERYPNLTPRDMVVLRSEKGCKKQLAHCDYEQDITFARCPDSQIPLGCLVCIMEGTTIDVWLKSIRLPCLDTELTDEIVPIPRTTISLKRGQILVFRGDLVHAGSSYDHDNCRIHVFMDSDMVPRYPNRTYFIYLADYILDE